MYEPFYGLGEPPFRLTPDPHFLYLSPQHREALAHLLYGLREGSGFVAVTGEVGTGKTTLLRALLRDLEPDTLVGYLFNPALSDVELLQTINGEFSLPASSTSKKDLIDALNRFLLAQRAAGRRVAVIVDEAQNLPPATLEQLRLLSNLETETDKLLQIVLVGQPELRDLLRRPELVQLDQRITVRWHLAPLDRRATAAYVRHRMRVAGGVNATRIFTGGALRRIYAYAGGVPRLVNIVAHRALLAGYTAEARTVGVSLVRRAIGELRQASVPPSTRRRVLWPGLAAATAAFALATAAAFALLHGSPASESGAQDRPRQPGAAGESGSDAKPQGADAGSAALARGGADPEDGSVGTHEAAARPSEAATGPDAPRAGAGTAGSPPEAKVEEPPAVLAAVAVDSPREAVAGPEAEPRVDEEAAKPARFWDELSALDHRSAAAAATRGLLAAWKVDVLRLDEQAAPRLDLGAIAERRGLRYLQISGTLARLQLLDLPAILELSLPSGQRRFAVLTAIEGDQLVLRVADTETRLGPRELDRVWLGDAHLFWRDFESLSSYLAPGSTGPEVGRLQRLLARVGEYRSVPSLAYDPATTEAIARFQRSRQLLPDGIVGPLTKIVLYDALATYDHPRLSGGT